MSKIASGATSSTWNMKYNNAKWECSEIKEHRIVEIESKILEYMDYLLFEITELNDLNQCFTKWDILDI